MKIQKIKNQLRLRRQQRTRAKISGTADRPRLSVFRSLSHISAQLIDDVSGQTLVSATDKEIKGGQNKTEIASLVGQALAEKAQAKKIATAVFDKGSYKYHGRVQALADGARTGGLKI